MKTIVYSVSILASILVHAQPNDDSLFIRKIYNEALARGQCYENLRSLCKDVGARVTGSAEADMAVVWGRELLESYKFHNVYLQEIKVPHWERGTGEAGWMLNASGKMHKFNILALGGSEGTNGLISGEVVEVQSVEDMDKMDPKAISGKIVFYNKPFDQTYINTFNAYGACANQRWAGASAASRKGAKAVIIRSLASSTDEHPHTGSMQYDEDIKNRIPAAAISTLDADKLTEWLKSGTITVKMEMDCQWHPEKISYNVIAEEPGHEDDKIITFGGHLDSWDVGEGAHDDGAGIVHCIEALRILKTLGYQPNHTLRCVLFMNEENGNFGGKTYAELSSEHKEEHLCAIESDRGGFLPIGFEVLGDIGQVLKVQEIAKILEKFELYRFQAGYSGVDVRPLLDYFPEMLQLGMSINSQRYFDYHHCAADVFENVNKRELELGAAAMAAMIYLIDQNF